MNVNKENVCRLCFNEVENQFQEICEVTREIFDVLLLNVNLNIIENPIVCHNCAEKVLKSIYFKLLSMDTEKIIFSIVVDKQLDKISLNDMYILKDSNRGEVVKYEDFNVCRFCLKKMRSNFMPMDRIMNEAKLVKMLPLFMPEVDFNISENPVMCTSCRENLECYFNFIRNCRSTEDRISTSYESGKIFKRLKTDTASDVYDRPKKMGEWNISVGDNVQTDHLRCTVPTDAREQRYKCTECTHETRYKRALKRHMLTHRDASELEMYKCTACPFETKYKSGIKSHVLIHKPSSEVNMHKCETCTYETRSKKCFSMHIRNHKNVSEIKTYQCDTCAFETKYKTYLKHHMLVHKNISEVDIFKCTVCTFKTKYRSSLRVHKIMHKDASEVETYKCTYCPYASKYKCHLKSHMLTHKDASEVEMHECTSCAFASKYKKNLVQHMKTHA